MTAAWTDEARAVEGRPDAQEEAVALYTMHAAKGLEWPIVVPVNTMTAIMAPESAVTDRADRPILLPGLRRQARRAMRPRATRRRPSSTASASGSGMSPPRGPANCWFCRGSMHAVEVGLDLPPRSVSRRSAGASISPTCRPRIGLLAPAPGNAQTREIFAAEAAAIAAPAARLTWLAPSRDESTSGAVFQGEEPTIWNGAGDDQRS